MRTLTAAILLLFTLSLSAQKNFQPGFVVFDSGDTLHGQINYKAWEYNPRKILFIENGRAVEQTLSVVELSSFGIEGRDIYQRAVVTLDMAPVTLDLLEPEGYRNYVKDTVFLRELVQGSQLALYEYANEKLHFFIWEAGKEPELLTYKMFSNPQATGAIIRQNTFQGQLQRFTTSARVRTLIDRTSYSRKDLVNAVKAIDGTATATGTKTKPTTYVKTTRLFGSASLLYQRIRFTNNQYIEGLDRGDANYNFAAGVNIYPIRQPIHFFLTMIASYNSYFWKASFERPAAFTSGTQREVIRYNLKINTVSAGSLVNYAFYNTKLFNVYAATGLLFNFSSYPVNEYTIDNVTTGSKQKRTPFPFEKLWVEAPGRVGIHFANLDVSVNSKLLGSFSRNNSFTTKYRTYALTAALQF